MASPLGLVWLVLAFTLVFKPVAANTCSNQAFSCSHGLCVSEDCVCDFTDDCGDSSDENNCE